MASEILLYSLAFLYSQVFLCDWTPKAALQLDCKPRERSISANWSASRRHSTSTDRSNRVLLSRSVLRWVLTVTWPALDSKLSIHSIRAPSLTASFSCKTAECSTSTGTYLRTRSKSSVPSKWISHRRLQSFFCWFYRVVLSKKNRSTFCKVVFCGCTIAGYFKLYLLFTIPPFRTQSVNLIISTNVLLLFLYSKQLSLIQWWVTVCR